jgi:Fur family peroxide stress response transcriptional regulator
VNDFQKSDVALIEALRKKGYKATPQRIAICRLVLHNRDHPTAQRIHEEVQKVHPTVSLATVYKTLRVLEELDLIQELNFPQSRARFDSYMKPHVNLVCLRCGNIEDLDAVATREILEKVATTSKFAPTGQRFDMYGICRKCGNIKSITRSTSKSCTFQEKRATKP